MSSKNKKDGRPRTQSSKFEVRISFDSRGVKSRSNHRKNTSSFLNFKSWDHHAQFHHCNTQQKEPELRQVKLLSGNRKDNLRVELPSTKDYVEVKLAPRSSVRGVGAPSQSVRKGCQAHFRRFSDSNLISSGGGRSIVPGLVLQTWMFVLGAPFSPLQRLQGQAGCLMM